MLNQQYTIWKSTEYTYPTHGGFIPNIHTYIHDEDERSRPAILIVPGGGYRKVSSSEGENVALEFYQKGYNSFVLTYTINFTMEVPLKKQPLKDLSKAVVFIRKNAASFHIKENQIILCGFSAGGHLCGSLAVHSDEEALTLDGEFKDISNIPNGLILSYPVITSGIYAHKESFIRLLGKDAPQEELDYMSLEKHVTKNTPPVFLWHTGTDESVPVENSTFFVEACKKNHVLYELHIFDKGIHGMSLANEEWENRSFGGDYTLEQSIQTILHLRDQGKLLPAPYHDEIPMEADRLSIIQLLKKRSGSKKDEGIAIWPILADHWIKKNIL